MTDLALDDFEVVAQAKRHYSQTESYQASLRALYDTYHRYYAPDSGDQWPEDRVGRPDKVHVTINICKPAVDIDARLQSILPRISCTPISDEPAERLRADAAEKAIIRTLEATDWEVWLGDLCQIKCIYGKGVLKPFWNKDGGHPDVHCIETPGNLHIGWGTSDFKTKDWALFEYSISALEVQRQYPLVDVEELPHGRVKIHERSILGTADDPLGLHEPGRVTPNYVPSDYEDNHVPVWDYWYRDKKGIVHNAIIVGGVLARPQATHPELLDIPYIVIENEHEPGSPDGISTLFPIIDVQAALNGTVSHWIQSIEDDIDPAWQATGENSSAIPPGIVPKAGEITPMPPSTEVRAIPKPPNQQQIQMLVKELWDEYHKLLGMPEILFGQPTGVQSSGRSLAVQIEAAINRLDRKRRPLYRGLRELIMFWLHMLSKKGLAVEVDGEQVPMAELLKGLNRWKIVAPEITPRDVIENTQNVINKVQAKLLSNRSGMDELGVDSPEDEIKLIEEERSNVRLYPGEVQTIAAVIAAVMQMMQAFPQLAGTSVGQALTTANDLSGQNFAAQQAQQAQPTLMNDQNAPMSQAGSPPPAGGPAPTPVAGGPTGALTGTTLVRNNPQTGQATTLNQLANTYRVGG